MLSLKGKFQPIMYRQITCCFCSSSPLQSPPSSLCTHLWAGCSGERALRLEIRWQNRYPADSSGLTLPAESQSSTQQACNLPFIISLEFKRKRWPSMSSTREEWMGFSKCEPTHQAFHWLFKPSPNQRLPFEACKLFLITHPFWLPANFPPWKGLRTRRKWPSYPQGGSIPESCENASQEIPLLAFQIHQLESLGKHPKILGSPPNGNWILNLCNRVHMHFRPLTVNSVVLWCEVLDWWPIIILW